MDNISNLIKVSFQGISTYDFVVAMRTQSEPPGPSVDGGDQQSFQSSPVSSAVTVISGRSSHGMGLQYKGAWCTPPRIFMDQQVLCLPLLSFKKDSDTISHLLFLAGSLLNILQLFAKLLFFYSIFMMNETPLMLLELIANRKQFKKK